MNDTNLIYLSLSLSLVLLLVVIWLVFRLVRMEKMRKEFFASGLKKDLEQILIDQNRMISKINLELKEQDSSLNGIYKDNRNNFQKIGFIRFNPFGDAGGNMSFALALLNAHDDGFVFSSLHGREGTRVYAKSVKSGLSESKLTEEELKAIKQAK
jgi:hypothetical protein